jgi:site-specific recombinase XerC
MDPHVIVSPHTLHQSDSVTVLKSDVLLNGLRVQLGHTDLKATSIYPKGHQPPAEILREFRHLK